MGFGRVMWPLLDYGEVEREMGINNVPCFFSALASGSSLLLAEYNRESVNKGTD